VSSRHRKLYKVTKRSILPINYNLNITLNKAYAVFGAPVEGFFEGILKTRGV